MNPPAQQQHNLPRMNDRIRISPIRVVNQDGEMLGEMETHRALEMAEEAGLDLVEVSPDARPPVCRIMDFGKSQYERQKKQSSGPKQHRMQVKQIRLRAKTGKHDIEVKVRKAREFLYRKDKVKINVMFRGRENAHHERGREMLDEIVVMLQDCAILEQSPRMESGRMMSCTVAPNAAIMSGKAKPPRTSKDSSDDDDDLEDDDDDLLDEADDDADDDVESESDAQTADA